MNNADPGTPPGNGPSPTQAELAVLQTQFPGFRIWRERACDHARYVARSLHPGLSPHTVVTDDIGELRAALEPSRPAACPGPRATRQ